MIACQVFREEPSISMEKSAKMGDSDHGRVIRGRSFKEFPRLDFSIYTPPAGYISIAEFELRSHFF